MKFHSAFLSDSLNYVIIDLAFNQIFPKDNYNEQQ